MIPKLKIWNTLLLIMTTCVCMANPADPTPHQVKQPDGTSVTLRMHGDEYLNYVTTTDGFTVVKDENGFWVYARKLDDGTLAATTVVAHNENDRTDDEKDFLSDMPKGLAPKMDSRRAEMRQNERVHRAKTRQQRRASKTDLYSNFRGLIILVEFNDRSFMYGNEMNSIVNDMANKEGYTGDERTNKDIPVDFVGSVRDYYRDNSNGMFQPQFDVIGPVKIDRSQYFAEQTNNGYVLAYEAVEAADPLVDFTKYDSDGNGKVDMVFFLYAGCASNDPRNDQRLIWPYASSFGDNLIKDGIHFGSYACSTEIMTTEEQPLLDGIGVICHEFGHVLGLPDLYDIDYAGSGGYTPGVNFWSLMANGGYLGNRRVPCNLTIYERHLLDFVSDIPTLSETGTYSLREAGTDESFRLVSPDNEKEFFMFENRQPVGWDVYLPGHGLLAIHVDYRDLYYWYSNMVNADPNHMCYEVLFAGGNNGATPASDPFPGQGNVTMLTNTTSPANLLTRDGNNSQFGLAHITETDGVISFDLVDASTFSEIIMPEPEDMYEGICYHLEPQIYMPTTTYETKWESDNHNVATVDQQGNVTAVAKGTAHITLTAGDVSATYNATVVPANVVPNIESLLPCTSNTYQVLQLNNAQVFFEQNVNGRNWLFVRDGTRSIELDNFHLDAVPGDVLNGLVYGQYNNDMEWLSMHSAAGIYNEGSIQITHGPTPEPNVVTPDNLNSIHIMDYITMKGATLGYKQINNETRLCILAGDKNILLNWSYLKLSEPVTVPSAEELESNLYDIEIIVSYFNSPGKNDSFLMTAPLTPTKPTGIDQPITLLPQKEGIYNLQGQRLSAPSKGINIINGNKVVIK